MTIEVVDTVSTLIPTANAKASGNAVGESIMTKPQVAFKPGPVSFEGKFIYILTHIRNYSNIYTEWRDCTELTFEWADSYDTKDWARLASILAPTISVNYASVNDYRNDALPATEFVSMVSSPGFLGDKNVDTQHLMGACKLQKLSEDKIEGKWQIRAAHQRYREEVVRYPGVETTAKTKGGDRAVLLTGHSHATITLFYKKVDGAWKWAGIVTDIRWNESGFDKMFAGFEAGKAA
ncbi:Scytalone dehydratase-like protein [Cladobotryum mycophilum]|uniref:Scytalone dehydratase-like protein n=1 Tax=Cladobotryum mycophilum TaxID=491253 RepID=A0ABR0SNQ5_9HYPO